jgi:hypothetical protein
MTENLDTGASGAADARHLLGLVDRRVTTDVAMLSALVTDRDGGPPTFFRALLTAAGLAVPQTDVALLMVWKREQQRAHAAYAAPPRPLPPRLAGQPEEAAGGVAGVLQHHEGGEQGLRSVGALLDGGVLQEVGHGPFVCGHVMTAPSKLGTEIAVRQRCRPRACVVLQDVNHGVQRLLILRRVLLPLTLSRCSVLSRARAYAPRVRNGRVYVKDLV